MCIRDSYNPVIEEKDFDSSWSIETATQILLSDEECKIDGEGAVSLEGLSLIHI